MAAHRKDLLDIQRIIQLKARGESNRSISRLLGINRKTVNEYILNLGGSGKDFSVGYKVVYYNTSKLFPRLHGELAENSVYIKKSRV
jgi:hypothetical protein